MSEKNSGRARSAPSRTMLRRTLFLLSVCGIAAFAVLILRLGQLQIVDHEKYERAAVEQQLRGAPISAERGTIYDRDGRILAMSASVDTIYLSPAEIAQAGEDVEAIADGLSEILGVDRERIVERAQNTSSWYEVVARKVEPEVAARVREFKEEGGYTGIKVEADTKRYYPYGSLAAHVIGFVGTDNNGLGGIEARYEDALAGEAGYALRTTTAAGTELLYTNFEDYVDAADGEDVTLTIDAQIQYFVEKHLAQAVEDYDIQDGAAAICMEVDTGAILSMVSLGSFDLNDYQSISPRALAEIDAAAADEDERSALIAAEQQRQWRNKAISDTYEPGSTFKIITLAMALEEGVAGEDSSYYCGGQLSVPGRGTPVKCWKHGGHGSQTLTQAVQHSCNVAFVNIGLAVGEERFYDYAEAFGFLERTGDRSAQLTARTGIDLGGESGSIWWSEDVFCDPENYSQLAAASFGQTFNITPLQLVTAVSACVNGGYLMQPHLVERIVDAEGNTVSEADETPVRQVISEETSRQVCAILEQVVGDPNEGTGRNAAVAGYRIGGKTGTSTKTTEEIAGNKEYIVSFIGVAPADDPQIALLVLLDDPSSESGIYISGGQMAAPVVGKMLADILPSMGIEPDYSAEELEAMDRAVPDLTGMSVENARYALSQAGLSCRVVGAGEAVSAQLPAANTVIASGSEVIIYAGAEPDSGTAPLPDLRGMSYSAARDALAAYGLYLNTDSAVSDADGQAVSAQDIFPGTEIARGGVVTVTLVDADDSMLGEY